MPASSPNARIVSGMTSSACGPRSHGVPGQGPAAQSIVVQSVVAQSIVAMRCSQERQSDQSAPCTHRCQSSCMAGLATRRPAFQPLAVLDARPAG